MGEESKKYIHPDDKEIHGQVSGKMVYDIGCRVAELHYGIKDSDSLVLKGNSSNSGSSGSDESYTDIEGNHVLDRVVTTEQGVLVVPPSFKVLEDLKDSMMLDEGADPTSFDVLKANVMGIHAHRFDMLLLSLRDADFVELYLKMLQYVKPKMKAVEEPKPPKVHKPIEVLHMDSPKELAEFREYLEWKKEQGKK